MSDDLDRVKKHWAEYRALREKQKDGTITPEEREEMKDLLSRSPYARATKKQMDREEEEAAERNAWRRSSV